MPDLLYSIQPRRVSSVTNLVTGSLPLPTIAFVIVAPSLPTTSAGFVTGSAIAPAGCVVIDAGATGAATSLGALPLPPRHATRAPHSVGWLPYWVIDAVCQFATQ